MGILDDLAMGFGLKARTEDYDARTARNIAETQAFGDDHVAAMRARQGYVSTGPRGRDYAAEYRAALENGARNSQGVMMPSQAQQYLRMAGGEDRPNYNPSIVQNDDRGFVQRALFSPESPESPRPYAIGPMKMDGPLQIPSISMMGILQDFAEGFRRPQDRGPMTNNEAAQSSGLIGSTDDDVAMFEELIIRANGESAGRAIIDAIAGDFEKLRGAAEKAQQTLENVGPYE